MLDFFGWIIGVVFKIFFAIAGLILSNIPNWVWFTITALIVWRICTHFWRQHQAEKSEEAIRAKKREADRQLNSTEAKIAAARKLQEAKLSNLCAEYEQAINRGDQFIATAKGRRYYAFNRIYRGADSLSQVIADEITIKNEVLKRKLRPAL